MLGLTASTPKTFPWRLPERKSRRPPALVETQPPIKQLPLAPRSKGIISPTVAKWVSKSCKTQPASQVSTPDTENPYVYVYVRKKKTFFSSDIFYILLKLMENLIFYFYILLIFLSSYIWMIHIRHRRHLFQYLFLFLSLSFSLSSFCCSSICFAKALWSLFLCVFHSDPFI